MLTSRPKTLTISEDKRRQTTGSEPSSSWRSRTPLTASLFGRQDFRKEKQADRRLRMEVSLGSEGGRAKRMRTTGRGITNKVRRLVYFTPILIISVQTVCLSILIFHFFYYTPYLLLCTFLVFLPSGKRIQEGNCSVSRFGLNALFSTLLRRSAAVRRWQWREGGANFRHLLHVLYLKATIQSKTSKTVLVLVSSRR